MRCAHAPLPICKLAITNRVDRLHRSDRARTREARLIGRVAGAGLPGHLHWHLVPRWNGDTNFMPVLGEVKVINEHLQRSWEKLSRAFNA